MTFQTISSVQTEIAALLPHHQSPPVLHAPSLFPVRMPNTDPDSDQCWQKLRHRLGLPHFVGRSPLFAAVVSDMIAIAQTNASVLIVGETGTGKELSARAIHALSARGEGPFVPINCGALPVDLVENELFGHERGAFTGAVVPHAGVIHEAEGGTLFLDEIDSLPLMAQVKLLRFLQEKEYRSLGSAKLRQANVRIIAATNANLAKALAEGALRRDLYYRINTLQLVLPPLRERPEDIPLLTHHFVTKYREEYKKMVTAIASDALQLLLQYDWPGNIRELEHVVARAVALAAQPTLQTIDIRLPQHASTSLDSFQVAKTRVIAEFEKTYIQRLLMAYDGNITKAAQAAGKHRRAFWELMRKHHIRCSSLGVVRSETTVSGG
jgi:two-component system response regulator GlrR